MVYNFKESDPDISLFFDFIKRLKINNHLKENIFWL